MNGRVIPIEAAGGTGKSAAFEYLTTPCGN